MDGSGKNSNFGCKNSKVNFSILWFACKIDQILDKVKQYYYGNSSGSKCKVQVCDPSVIRILHRFRGLSTAERNGIWRG